MQSEIARPTDTWVSVTVFIFSTCTVDSKFVYQRGWLKPKKKNFHCTPRFLNDVSISDDTECRDRDGKGTRLLPFLGQHCEVLTDTVETSKIWSLNNTLYATECSVFTSSRQLLFSLSACRHLLFPPFPPEGNCFFIFIMISCHKLIWSFDNNFRGFKMDVYGMTFPEN